MGQCQSQCNKMLSKEQSEEEIHHNKSNVNQQSAETTNLTTSSKKVFSPINQQNMSNNNSNTGQTSSASTLMFSMKENYHASAANSQTQTGGQATNNNIQSSSQVSSLTQLAGKQGISFTHTQTEKDQSQKQATLPEFQQQETLQKSIKKETAYEGDYSPKMIQKKVQFRACVSIFYGTMDGTASELAFNLAEKCESEGFYVKVIRLLHFEPWMVRACQVSVFILASQGQQRGPTDDSQQFYLWLNNFDNKDSPLKNLKYAVFGLYNSLTSKKGGNDTTELDSTNYLESLASPSPDAQLQQQAQSDLLIHQDNQNTSRFNIALTKKPTPIKSMGQRIDMVLEEIGAQRFIQLRQIDSSKPDILTEAFKLYSNGLVEALLMAYPAHEISEEESFNMALPFRISLTFPQEKDCQAKNEEFRKRELDRQYSTLGRNGKKSYPLREEMWEYFSGWIAPVQKIEFQKSSDTSKNNTSSLSPAEFMSVQLDASAGEIFETGGQVDIFPENDEFSVENLIKILGLEENIQLQVKSQQNSLPVEFRSPMPSPLYVHQYLKEFLDMHGTIDQSQVYELSAFCANKSDTEKLRKLCQFSNKSNFDKEITQGATPSLYELIVTYKISIPLPLLCGLSRLLKPRTFVIASSNAQKPLKLCFIARLQSQSPLNNSSKQQQAIEQQPKYKCTTTEYLKEIYNDFNKKKKNLSMRVKCSQNPLWRLPLKQKNLRILFICIEEGIGLCRAFIQEQQASKNANNNEIHLFYGCRALEDGNYLLSQEISQWNKENLLQSTSIALTDSSGDTKNIFKQNEFPKTSSQRLNHSVQNNNNSSNNIPNSSHNINNKIDQSERNNQDPSSKQSSKLLVLESINDKQDTASQKSNWSPLQVLIENSLVQFSNLIENIAEKEESVKIFICGSQLLSQGLLGAIAKAYSVVSKQTQYAAFSSVLDFENDGKIVRVTWTSQQKYS